MKIFESLLEKILENIAFVFVSALVAVAYFFRDIIEQNLIIIALFASIFLTISLFYLIFYKKTTDFAIRGFRLRNGSEVKYHLTHFGVLWTYYLPSPISYSPFEKDEYVWVLGPYCPKCFTSLIEKKPLLKKKEWFCEHCESSYVRPKGHKYEIQERIKDLIEANVYRKQG